MGTIFRYLGFVPKSHVFFPTVKSDFFISQSKVLLSRFPMQVFPMPCIRISIQNITTITDHTINMLLCANV